MVDMATVPSTRLRRRWVLIAITAMTVSFLAAGSVWHIFRSGTLAAIEAVGGELEYDSRNPPIAFVRDRVLRQRIPQHLYMGPRQQDKRFYSQVYNEKLLDEHLLQLDLSQLGQVSLIDISGPHVTDKGFLHVAASLDLRQLICRRSRITDAGLKALLPNSKLSFLVIPGNDISNEGLTTINQFPQLMLLDLVDTRISELPNMSRLYYLYIRSTDIEDISSLSNSQNLPSLQAIELDSVQCTDQAVQILASRAKPIEGIGISACSAAKRARLLARGQPAPGPVDDALLARLTPLKSLQYICIYGTNDPESVVLTSEIVASLQAMPALSLLCLIGCDLPPNVKGRLALGKPGMRVINYPGD